MGTCRNLSSEAWKQLKEKQPSGKCVWRHLPPLLSATRRKASTGGLSVKVGTIWALFLYPSTRFRFLFFLPSCSKFSLLKNDNKSFLRNIKEVWNDVSGEAQRERGERINSEYKKETIQERESTWVSISNYSPATSEHWGLHCSQRTYPCHKSSHLSCPVP